MLGAIIRHFLSEKGDPEADLQGVDGDRKLKVAATVLFLEIAKSDSVFVQEEFLVIKNILKETFGLEEDEITRIIEIAEEEREESSDLYPFTNLINKKLSKEEKLSLMEKIWQVIYADGILHKYEDYLAHKLANLLRLNHDELINTKLKVKKESGL